MKKLISKYWKNILLICGIVGMVAIFTFKVSAPKTIISDYIKYGKDLTAEGNSQIINSVTGNFWSVWNRVDSALIRIVILIMALILFVCVLTFMANAAGKKDAKKK